MKKVIVLFLIFLCVISRAQGLLTGLTACYPLDCDAGINQASTGSQYNGSLAGSPPCTTGHLNAANTAYQFNGLAAFRINSNGMLGSQFVTVSAWYYIASGLSANDDSNLAITYMNACNGWIFNLRIQGSTSGPQIRLETQRGCSNPNSYFVTSGVVASGWHHIVFCISNTSINLWVDTTPYSLSTPNLPIVPSTVQTVIFAGLPLGGFNAINGPIDNIRFYDRQLTTNEIADLYTNDPACSSQGIPAPPPPAPGNNCGNTLNALTTNYQMALNNFNYNFTNSSGTSGKVLIGQPICGTGVARLHVEDDNLGNGIYANCMTAAADNIALRGNAGDPTSGTANNIFGVLGEANLNPGNIFGNSAGVAGFCGPYTPGFMPPGQNVGLYGNSVANAGRWAGYFDGDVQFNGTVWGSQFWWGSDKRLKTNIRELENVTEKLKNIKSYSYLYAFEKFKKRNLPQNEQIGFLAQELQETFPQIVTKDDHDFLAVNYVGFIPVLLQAHKEQQEAIEKQAADLDRQKKEIEELRNLISSQGSTSEKATGYIQNQSITLSDATAIVLNQNVPNPFAENTVITYNIPGDFTKAEIIFTTDNGVIIKSVSITTKGKGSLTVYADDLSHGVYTYTLIVDGITKDSKNMIKQ